jgi:hypothetical protein
MLNLVLARGYVAKLVDNKAVFRYLERNHGEVLEQLMGLVRATSRMVESCRWVNLRPTQETS